jgi:hypothetical protein
MVLKNNAKIKNYHNITLSNGNKANYIFGTGNNFIDGNFLSGPDIERAVNGRPLPDEEEDDRIW